MKIDISSTSNPKVKWLRNLHNNTARRKEGVFLVEGAKEIKMALDGGYQLHSLFVCPELEQGLSLQKELQNQSISNEISSLFARRDLVTSISKNVFEKITYRSGSDGLLAVFQAKNRTLDQLTFGENPLFLILEGVEKPGNLGAIIRSADGAGVDAIIVCDPKCDVFNPNVIRSSVGTLFSKQIATAANSQVSDFLEKHEITAYGALLSEKSKPYNTADFTLPSAIILGTEHEGLTDFWIKRTKPVIIPMQGVNDSLNVSNAAAILIYEALRQRETVKKDSETSSE